MTDKESQENVTLTSAAVFRVLSDLIKSDNIISASEMGKLDDFSKSLKISEQDKIASCSITLSSASSFIASMPQKSRDMVLKIMREALPNWSFVWN